MNGTIVSAQLKMIVTADPGNGLIKVFKGSSNNWTETNLSTGNRPNPSGELASLNGNFNLGQTYTWNLDASQLSGGGALSLIMQHMSGNDVAFASKENRQVSIPKLIIEVSGGVPPVCTVPQVTRLELFNAATDQFVRVLTNGDVIDRSVLPQFNIVAITEDCNGQKVESVIFRRNGSLFRTENVAPYAMGGDNPPGNYSPTNLSPGQNIIRATPYTKDNGQGIVGKFLEITIQVTMVPYNPTRQPKPALPFPLKWACTRTRPPRKST
ncbi:MAG: hypothetical protein HC880_04005 [Bacteroidia bacterium]|nr:hypothetical protein [Bacteroidia bacterium]